MKVSYCGLCGNVLCSQNYLYKEKDCKLSNGFRRIRCSSESKGSSCKNIKSISVAPIEKAILEYCSDKMELSSVLGDNDKTSELKANIAQLYQQVQQKELAIKTGEQSIADLLTKGEGVSVITNVVEQFKIEYDKLRQNIVKLEDELRYEGHNKSSDLMAEWNELKHDIYNLDENARLMIRQLVKRTFKRIDIFLHGMDKSDSKAVRLVKESLGTDNNTIDMILTFHNDKTRIISIDKKTGAWLNGGDVTFSYESLSQALKVYQKIDDLMPA